MAAIISRTTYQDFVTLAATNTVPLVRSAGEGLLLCLQTKTPFGTLPTVSSVVWDAAGDNQAFTLVNSVPRDANGDQYLFAVYYLPNPASAKTSAATVTFSNAPASSFVRSITRHITGHASALPVRASGVASTAISTSTPATNSVVSTNSDLIVDFAYGQPASPDFYVVAPQTGGVYNPTGIRDFGSSIAPGLASSTPMQWVTGIGGPYWVYLIAASIQAGPAALVFTGTVSDQSGVISTAFSAALASYFGGGSAPFTYSVFSGSLPAGITLNTSTGALSGTPTTAGVSAGIVIRATDATSATAQTNAFSITVSATADTTPPTLTGAITASAITQTTATLSWPAGTDNVAVVGYNYSLNGGTSYTPLGNVLTVNLTGLVAGTTYPLRVSARDGAGNVSTPVLTSSLTTTALPVGTVDLSGAATALKLNSGQVHANISVRLAFSNPTTDVLAVTKTLTTSAAGICGSVSDAALTPGQAYDIKFTVLSGASTGAKGIFVASAV